jgi:hypothetical protein
MASFPIKRLVSPELPATGSETPVITKKHTSALIHVLNSVLEKHTSVLIHALNSVLENRLHQIIISHSHCLFLFQLILDHILREPVFRNKKTIFTQLRVYLQRKR